MRTLAKPSVFVIMISIFFWTTSVVFAQSFKGLGDLSGGTVASLAMDVSADGKVVVGVSNSGGPQAFRWTESSGIKGLGFLAGGNNSYAIAVSTDGSVITGWSNSSNTSGGNVEAFRWVDPGAMVGMGDLLGGQFNSQGNGIAANGGVIVGKGSSANTEAFLWLFAFGMTGLGHLSGGTVSQANDVWSSGGDAIIVGSSNASGVVNEAFYYDTPGPMVGMGFLPNANSKESEATAISANGKVIVGWGASATLGAKEAFRYVYPSGPMQGLGFLPAPNPKTLSKALDVSSDGSVVVGFVNASSGSIAFIWDASNGMRDLKRVLMEHYGLNLTGWTLNTATGISDDGLTIVGGGTNPSGLGEAWIAKLTGAAPPIPANFDFNTNTTQNWTLDQIYETSTQTKKTPTLGFFLHNDQNQLAATANPLVIDGSSTNTHDIYLESPDLSSTSAWQNITGYSIDIQRTFASLCGEPPNTFFAQLQLRVIDTTDNSDHLFAENDGTNFVFHEILLGKSYHFVWKPSFLSDPKYKVKKVRIRLTGSGDIPNECAAKGSWLIDNVGAEGGTPPQQSITVLEPNGGEKWYVGSQQQVWWTSQNFSDPVKIEYSTNGGSVWKTLTSSTTNQTYPWTIPDEPSSNYLVRVSDAADGNPSDVSDAKFSILKAGLTITAPNGGEVWQVGSQQNITWTSQNIPDNDVTIELSTDNGATYKSIGVHTNNEPSESHSWTVPNSPSTQSLIRLSLLMQGVKVEDVSDATFTIASQPQASLTVTSPNGGEDWQVGSNHNITWTSQNFSDPVKIEYSTDGGTSYKSVISSTANDGSHAWTIPNDPSTTCLVKVSDAADGNPFDVSNAVFTISSASNTSAGKNVQVDVGNGVKVTFEDVTSPGKTTLDVKTSGPPPPSGFKIMPSGLPVYFDINTTASFTGKITISIAYNDAGMTLAEEAKLRLHVYESPPGQWKDITVLPVDVNANIIRGTVTHLTLFAMMIGPSHFTFTSPTQESYSIVMDNATLDGAQLTNGDEIGVFTPAGLCVGASVWDGTTPLALTAWADDSQTGAVDGYKTGEKMAFRIWDAGAGSNEDYEAKATYSLGSGNFGDGAYTRISLLAAVTSVTQALSLSQGWSWISFNVAPADLTIDKVMAGVSNLVIVVNGAGQFYIPNVINNIGQMNVLEGYKIYVSAPDQVSVSGKPVTATTPIALKAGWDFVSYLPSKAMSAETALASVLSQLAIVKNDEGKFFIPNVINSLGNMTPGDGYKLYLNADATLAYPQGSTLAKQVMGTPVTTAMRPTHFKFRARTGESYSVVVHSLQVRGQQPEIGDEVGLFTTAGLWVGAGVWDGSGVIGIAAWADDERTDELDGYRAGEVMHFRFWDADAGEEIALSASFSRGSGKFGEEAFAAVDLQSARVPTSFTLAQNYPNPFNASTVISYQLPEAGRVELRIYNLLGEVVRILVDKVQEAGLYKVQWDGRDAIGNSVPSGVYLYHIKSGSVSAVKKAVFVK